MMLLDDEDTWPEKLLAVLRGGLSVLAAYEERRAAIDDAAESDIFLRIHRPSNDYEDARRGILEACDELTAGTDLVGWHCTRLTEAEAGEIRRLGLWPLSPELAAKRLTAAAEGGLLPAAVLDALRSRNQAAADNRTGRVYLILSAFPALPGRGRLPAAGALGRGGSLRTARG